MAPFYADPATRPPLLPDKFSLQPDEAAFFRALTGIDGDDELKDHILRVQAKAYEIYGYPCIRRFSFLRLKISRLDGYPKALSLLHSRTHPILLDLGCCFGNDARKAVVDGWPVADVVASDLRQAFWSCGHDLFNSTPQSFPAIFIPGDIFDLSFLDISTLPAQQPDLSTPLASLNLTHSITPLIHRVSAIHASSFFHLFSETQQTQLATLLAALLVPAKGSVIFGQHNAMPETGYRVRNRPGVVSRADAANEQDKMFCHSPESWAEMWSHHVFGPLGISVNVDARLTEVEKWEERTNPASEEEQAIKLKFYLMDWFVEIL